MRTRPRTHAGVQGMVLLKNDGLLPLKAGSKIAVVGPMGVNQANAHTRAHMHSRRALPCARIGPHE
jgi:hypothetical protein